MTEHVNLRRPLAVYGGRFSVVEGVSVDFLREPMTFGVWFSGKGGWAFSKRWTEAVGPDAQVTITLQGSLKGTKEDAEFYAETLTKPVLDDCEVRVLPNCPNSVSVALRKHLEPKRSE